MTFNRIRVESLIFIFLLGVYLVAALKNLDTLPVVYEDEPFIASTGWKMATEGKFGTDLFTGFYGMENKVFLFLPVYSFRLKKVKNTMVFISVFCGQLSQVFVSLRL